jgi:urease accessory protein
LQAGASWLSAPADVLLVRVLCNEARVARRVLEATWALLRPLVIGLASQRPRIWST